MMGLPVMESFYSIQGEGEYQGHAAYFIRLGGCDVGCVWCDVKESWDANVHPVIAVDQIVAPILAVGAKIAIVTGGEPLLHNCNELTTLLQNKGIRTHIETSGSSPISGNWDWICVSPKKFKPALHSVLAQANEIKVIVYNKSDLIWAEQFVDVVPKNCKLFLQPEWSKADDMIPLIVDYILKHPSWQLSLQIHKYLGVR